MAAGHFGGRHAPGEIRLGFQRIARTRQERHLLLLLGLVFSQHHALLLVQKLRLARLLSRLLFGAERRQVWVIARIGGSHLQALWPAKLFDAVATDPANHRLAGIALCNLIAAAVIAVLFLGQADNLRRSGFHAHHRVHVDAFRRHRHRLSAGKRLLRGFTVDHRQAPAGAL